MIVPQQIRMYLSSIVLLLATFPAAALAQSATGHLEVYCDGFGFFLAKVNGAPSGRLFLFLYTNFPGVPYVPKQEWKNVSVYRNGCIADGKCEVFARGRIWLSDEAARDSSRVFGKYEIERNGQQLAGQFAAKQRNYRHPPRICE